ncbi:UbiD family decarboxylase [Acetobacter sp. DsW_063]|uniref:UbiD family decarboxylase n=1 Tax=Acetobacter sp. DsW_063 TaxID=1514894 RepID=UPI000A3D10E5|nr:UbiD family decarboxylase [Acetobacter sp. DsW_063]
MTSPKSHDTITDAPVDDLRSAIDLLSRHHGQIISTQRPVDPKGELAGVYRHIGAGGTVMRPTRIGPAMMFESIKGFPDSRVLVGVMASRERVALLLGAKSEDLARHMGKAVANPVQPIVVKSEHAPVQEIVHRADDEGFDLRTLLPAPTNTPEDAGPFFCLGLVLGTDPDEGHSDVTIHRLCVQGKDELSIFFAPGRHIDVFRQKAEARGEALPITINMGLDPAIAIGACFEAPTTPFGYDELAVAGALRGKPVELAPAVTVDQHAIARAEIVIEGVILPNKRIREDINTDTGLAMPEFPGYTGPANPSLPVIKVTAVTMRKGAILQTLVGPGEEHVNLAGIPTEASILNACEAALPGFVKNVYAHSAGGGKLLAILQVSKRGAFDDGNARQAAIIALGAYRELKNVFLVDDDVDLFDTNDVLWAMQTRYQGDMDTMFLQGVTGHVLDPSQTPEYNPALASKGATCKTVFDCTAPWHLRKEFVRAQFQDVDPRPFAPDLFPGGDA